MYSKGLFTQEKFIPFSLLTFLLLFFGSCDKIENNSKFYKAISHNKEDTAYLKIDFTEKQFTGKYLVLYKDSTKDLGNLSGELVGDTLKGKFNYISRRNSKFIKPIAFLKSNENLKLGTGGVSTYMSIPFYTDGTIVFHDSLFQFIPIKVEEIKHLQNDLKISYEK